MHKNLFFCCRKIFFYAVERLARSARTEPYLLSILVIVVVVVITFLFFELEVRHERQFSFMPST